MSPTEDEIIAMQGDCPMCGAKDGDPCKRPDGTRVAAGKMHAGRLRKQLGIENPDGLPRTATK